MLYEDEKYSGSGKKGCAETSYLPGWDCHGLPIEQKALKAIGVGQDLQR
jgi:isoleucyl-tRNA synthetase